jgi:superfamily II DNA helicase RecQ
MATGSNVDAAIQRVLGNFGIQQLKPEQRKILDVVLSRRDCMAVLPTGYGKSLPYQVLIPVRRELGPASEVGKVVICSPLVALMKDQVDRLQQVPNIRAEMIGKDNIRKRRKYMLQSAQVLQDHADKSVSMIKLKETGEELLSRVGYR